MRYDFLAITNDKTIVVIDIKRSGYPINLDDLQRLEKYKSNLAKAHDKRFYMVMICSDKNLDQDTIKNWDKREDGEIKSWNEIFSRTNNFYNDYKAVLKGDIHNPDFKVKEAEVIKTRHVLETGSVKRSIEERKKGIL